MLLQPLNIVIIGTGNVAGHIAESFTKIKTLKLVQVFNHRKSKPASAFAKKHGAPLIVNYKELDTTADLYIISVKDDAIAEVVKHLSGLMLKGLVVHTSGSIDLSVLKTASMQTGVYYPLQTFTKNNTIDWAATPLLIEANTPKALGMLKKIANSISGTVKQVNSVTRLHLHVSAVFACNFTNALYAAAFEMIETNLSKKDTELLKPIMRQSFLKLDVMSPKQAQTGPAMRNDKVVMTKHLSLLKSDKQLTAVYKLVSELIIKQHI